MLSRIENGAAHVLRAAARSAMQEQRWHALPVANFFGVQPMPIPDLQHDRVIRAERSGGASGWVGPGHVEAWSSGKWLGFTGDCTRLRLRGSGGVCRLAVGDRRWVRLATTVISAFVAGVQRAFGSQLPEAKPWKAN